MPKRSAPDLGRSISLYQTSMEAEGKARSTVKSYTDSLMLLVHAFGTTTDPTTITVEDLELVVASWRRLSPTTRRNRLIAWRQFYKWGSRRHAWPDVASQLGLPRRDKPALRRLTSDEVKAMLEARTLERARTVIWVLAYSAIRIGELLELQWSDVDLVSGRLTVSHETAKGRKGRIVPIPAPLVDHLAAVKDARGEQHSRDDHYVIPHRRQAQFIPEDEAIVWTRGTSQMTIGRILKATAEQAGVRAPGEVTAHMFRRFYLERLLEIEPNIYVAMAIAGHASMQTTAEYGGGASIAATTRAVRGLSFGESSNRNDGRTWVRTKATSQQPGSADDVERIEPRRPESGGNP